MNSGLPGGVDGIIGLHTSEMNLSRNSIDPGKYDLLSVTEHEIDEVLGLSSALDLNSNDPLPEDFFRYTSSGSRTYTFNGDNAYFSIDGTNLLARFSQDSAGDYGDWWTAGSHAPQVQDAFLTAGAIPQPKMELIALDVIGYNLTAAPQPTITGLSLFGTNVVLDGANGLASGTYYVLTSTNLAQIHDFLVARNFPDYTLTKPLANLAGLGCATVDWRGRKVSMVCLRAKRNQQIFLFVMDRANLHNAPDAGKTEFAKVYELMTASWTQGDKVYILAGPGEAADLKAYLN